MNSHTYYEWDFYPYEDSTIAILVPLANFLNRVSTASRLCEAPLAVIAITVNIFHVIVLSRKSMRVHCVNVIMIWIAINDMLTTGYSIHCLLAHSLPIFDECIAPFSYTFAMWDQFVTVVDNSTRRLTAWFGFYMAALRLLILKTALNAKFNFLSKTSFSIIVMAVSSVISILISLFFVLHIELVYFYDWVPPPECEDLFPANFTKPYYGPTAREGFVSAWPVIVAMNFIDGASRLIPTVLLPIFAYLLVREINKARKRSKNLSSQSDQNKSDNTTKIVFLLALSFIITETPYGASYFLQAVGPLVSGVLNMFADIPYVVSSLVPIDSIVRCLLCLNLSTQYRQTAETVLPCLSVFGKKTTNSVKVASTHGKSSVVSGKSMMSVVN